MHFTGVPIHNSMNMMTGQMQSQQMPIRSMSTPEQQKQQTLTMQQHTNYGVSTNLEYETSLVNLEPRISFCGTIVIRSAL